MAPSEPIPPATGPIPAADTPAPPPPPYRSTGSKRERSNIRISAECPQRRLGRCRFDAQFKRCTNGVDFLQVADLPARLHLKRRLPSKIKWIG
jgi:hypothetical protein